MRRRPRAGRAGPRSGFLAPWREGQRRRSAGPSWILRISPFPSNALVRSPASDRRRSHSHTVPRSHQGRLSASPDATNLPQPNQAAYDQKRTGLLHGIGKAWRPVLLWLFVLAQTVAALRVVQLVWQRRWTFPLTLAAAAWGEWLPTCSSRRCCRSLPIPFSPSPRLHPSIPCSRSSSPPHCGTPETPGCHRASPDRPRPGPAPAGTQGIPLNANFVRILPWLGGRLRPRPFSHLAPAIRRTVLVCDDYFLIDQLASFGFWPGSGWSSRKISCRCSSCSGAARCCSSTAAIWPCCGCSGSPMP